jgi:hypothetical protein
LSKGPYRPYRFKKIKPPEKKTHFLKNSSWNPKSYDLKTSFIKSAVFVQSTV